MLDMERLFKKYIKNLEQMFLGGGIQSSIKFPLHVFPHNIPVQDINFIFREVLSKREWGKYRMKTIIGKICAVLGKDSEFKVTGY